MSTRPKVLNSNLNSSKEENELCPLSTGMNFNQRHSSSFETHQILQKSNFFTSNPNCKPGNS